MDETRAARPRRQLGLVVSICLNIALAAMVIAGLLSAVRNGRPPPGLLTPQGLMREASAPERARMQTIIAAHAANVKALRRADTLAREAAFRLFAGRDFSLEGFTTALAAVQKSDDALRAEQTEVVAECAAALSPAERAAIASTERRRLSWWRFLRQFSGS